MNNLAEYGTCDAYKEAVARFVDCSKQITNGEALKTIFSFMEHKYRNEYIYKSLLLKKIVYGRHSPSTTTAICELPVGKAIADFVIINGKACVYEIKTELDNLTRLQSQINEYYKAFRYVSVVCSERSFEEITNAVKDLPIGLMVLTKRMTFKTIREPQCVEDHLDPLIQFDLLRKAERENIILQSNFSLPNTSQVQYYAACLDIFKEIDPDLRNNLFDKALKARGSKVNQEALAMYPDAFKLIAYNHGASKTQGEKLTAFCNSTVE